MKWHRKGIKVSLHSGAGGGLRKDRPLIKLMAFLSPSSWSMEEGTFRAAGGVVAPE